MIEIILLLPLKDSDICNIPFKSQLCHILFYFGNPGTDPDTFMTDNIVYRLSIRLGFSLVSLGSTPQSNQKTRYISYIRERICRIY